MTMPLIDGHSHVYLPRYVDILRRRMSAPRIVTQSTGDRLIILPEEERAGSALAGRSIGSEFYDVERKLAFMDLHGIAVSIISSANPWVDFVEPSEAAALATQLNEDVEAMCAGSGGRLYGFGLLPLQVPERCAEELKRIATYPHIRGVILGSAGRGQGLDDPAFASIWQTAEELGLFIFIHPHYGVGQEFFVDTGHSLLLSLGFTFETSIAVARLILSGVLDRNPDLKLLVAHAGGTLPYLAGRLNSCVKNDRSKNFGLSRAPSDYLRLCYFDAIAYHAPALACLMAFADPARIFFGTDHPFFQPHVANPQLDATRWPVADENLAALSSLPETTQQDIAWRNAIGTFSISMPDR